MFQMHDHNFNRFESRRIQIILLPILLVLCIMIAGCAGNEVIAEYKDKSISRDEFIRYLNIQQRTIQQSVLSDKKMQEQEINKLIKHKILLSEAEKRKLYSTTEYKKSYRREVGELKRSTYADTILRSKVKLEKSDYSKDITEYRFRSLFAPAPEYLALNERSRIKNEICSKMTNMFYGKNEILNTKSEKMPVGWRFNSNERSRYYYLPSAIARVIEQTTVGAIRFIELPYGYLGIYLENKVRLRDEPEGIIDGVQKDLLLAQKIRWVVNDEESKVIEVARVSRRYDGLLSDDIKSVIVSCKDFTFTKDDFADYLKKRYGPSARLNSAELRTNISYKYIIVSMLENDIVRPEVLYRYYCDMPIDNLPQVLAKKEEVKNRLMREMILARVGAQYLDEINRMSIKYNYKVFLSVKDAGLIGIDDGRTLTSYNLGVLKSTPIYKLYHDKILGGMQGVKLKAFGDLISEYNKIDGAMVSDWLSLSPEADKKVERIDKNLRDSILLGKPDEKYIIDIFEFYLRNKDYKRATRWVTLLNYVPDLKIETISNLINLPSNKRIAVIEGLAGVKNIEVYPILHNIIETTTNSNEKINAIIAVGKLKDIRALPLLQGIDANMKEDWGVRTSAKNAINEIRKLASRN